MISNDDIIIIIIICLKCVKVKGTFLSLVSLKIKSSTTSAFFMRTV